MKTFDEKIYDYVNEMLTGVQPNAIKSMLRVRLMGILGTYFKQKEELEKKLADKEKEIERLKVYDEYKFELPYPKVKILGKTFEDIQELLDKWLKQGSKDKTDFAIEQLEKVKKFVISQLFIVTKDSSDLDEAEAKGCNELRAEIIKEIDNQIQELMGVKNERSVV